MRLISFSDASVEVPALITIQRGLTTLRWNTSGVDVTIGSDTWPAAPGARVTSIECRSDGTENNADVLIMAETGGPVEPGDGARGLLDGWPISVKLFDPADPAGTAREIVSGATIGSVAEDANGLVTIAASGQLIKAGVYLTEHYSLSGREDLGDARCKIDLTADDWTNSVTGQAIGTYTVVLDSLPDARATDPTWYVMGALIVRSGPLAGYPKIPIRAWDPDTLTVTLFLPVALDDIPAGTDLDIHVGCDLTREMCFSRFNNIVNLRAETFVPPPDVNF